ncbi:MAG: cysteine desulfurase family protein [Gammaproteobacteria bacterium]
MNRPIYLDYAATTPIDECVFEKMRECMVAPDLFGNPASTHWYGKKALKLVEKAREQVATFIQAKPSEIIWTSGATESNNLAIMGASKAHDKKHIITSSIEHPSVLAVCKALEDKEHQVSYLKPNQSGVVELSELEASIQEDTFLVSIMYVNNEIGTIQNISEIAAVCQKNKLLLHVDAAQAAGKIILNMTDIPIDFLSLSAHKIYGPKGIGALYVRENTELKPILFGGGHENGLRSGTLATHQIVGIGEACVIAMEEIKDNNHHIKKLRNQLIAGLEKLPGFQVNGALNQTVPHILNFSIQGVNGDHLHLAISKRLAVASGAACSSAKIEPSHVLLALGLPEDLVESSIRLSLGKFTTFEEIDMAVKVISEVAGLLS